MRKLNSLQEFFRLEATSGIILLSSAFIALLWANSPFYESYYALWQFSIAGMSVQSWINDGLMTIFFLVVGLEIKREIIRGELSSKKKAALPIAAALGGMLVPALIYIFFNRGSVGAAGWGIPMATDIAFALGVFTLFGKRIPSSLKIFLASLAIVDDMGAVLVIALFYTAKLSWMNILLGLTVLAVLFLFNRMRILNVAIYLFLGILAWFAFLESGIHATVTGVFLAFIIPSQTGSRIESLLHPWVSFGVMPIFALANAGVSLSGGTLFHPVSLGIITGLVIGKQIGISLFSWIAVRLGLAILPEKASWRHIYAIGCLGGIGFTMSLFVGSLAFCEKQLIDLAKLGILTASILSGLIGVGVIYYSSRTASKGQENPLL